jgi:hypothetical protein
MTNYAGHISRINYFKKPQALFLCKYFYHTCLNHSCFTNSVLHILLILLWPYVTFLEIIIGNNNADNVINY